MKIPKYFFYAALLLTVISGAFAQGRGHGGGNHSAARPDFDRNDHTNVFSQNSSRPPGWDKGKKNGWGDCNVPPGQAKKSGCHSTFTRHAKSRHKSDRDDRDRDDSRAHHTNDRDHDDRDRDDARARHTNDRDHDADGRPHIVENGKRRSPRDRR